MKRKIIKWISGKTFFATLAFLGLSIGAANAQITITTTSLPNGYIFSAYNETLTATGYTGIRWSISAGNLPDGLTLNSVSGVISGTPTATGTFNFTVKATEAMGGGSDSKSLSITIENQVWQIGAPNAADLTATLDASSTLTIKGKGTMQDFYIGTSPWYNIKNNITALVIQDGVKNIGNCAFAYCSGFTGNLTIPNSVTSIDGWAFYNCSGLTGNLTIPDSVTIIGAWAFEGCSGFTALNYNATNCTWIGNEVFIDCTNLTALNIGSNVQTIPDYAFASCANLTSVTNNRAVPQVINANVFNAATYVNATLYVPDASYTAYLLAAGWQNFNHIQQTTGIENVELQNLKIYPNPVRDELRIDGGELRIYKVEILDFSGKTLLSQKYNLSQIKVKDLPQGIYFLKLKTDKGTVTEKFIKE